MFNIILLAVTAIMIGVGMAKHRRRTNWARYLNGNVEIDISLTTLAPKTSAVGSTTSVVDTTRVGSIECTYSISDFTPGANIGPLIFGVAHGDYTQTQIDQWVEAAGSWDFGDKEEQEVRGRQIRQIGVFEDPAAVQLSSTINDGRPLKTKLNWMLAEGDALKFWVYNTGNAAIATTVPNFHAYGKANLWQV